MSCPIDKLTRDTTHLDDSAATVARGAANMRSDPKFTYTPLSGVSPRWPASTDMSQICASRMFLKLFSRVRL